MTATEKYNGWTNYETWAVNLHLTNDQGTDSYWREEAARQWEAAVQRPDYFSRSEAARYALAEQLKDEIEYGVPDLGCTLYGDLLNAALKEVDWNDIADGFLADFDGYESK